MSETRSGICFVLHADLHFAFTLEIVMLGFPASHRNLSHRRSSSLPLQRNMSQELGQDLSQAGQRSSFFRRQLCKCTVLYFDSLHLEGKKN